MASGSDVSEGFLCPICKVDCGSLDRLIIHYQEEEDQDQDQDVLKSVKGLLTKAKRKIQKLGEEKTSEISAEETHAYFINIEPQEIGVTRSYTNEFCHYRKLRNERYAAETNKLLVRWDKLISDMPSDPIKRKAHEQSIVPWIDDKDVKLCPNCTKNFNVVRRKHHCRLCGAVMCHDCSKFYQLPFVKKVASSKNTVNTTSSVRTGNTVGTSTNTLSSMFNFVENMTDQTIRLCVYCKQILDNRDNKQTRNQKPIICQFYDKLSSYFADSKASVAYYNKVIKSLESGMSQHTLSEAQSLRKDLFKLAESIDILSKKIAILGTKDVENPPKGKALQLQHMIRLAAIQFIRDWFIDKVSLPIEN